MSNPKKPCRRPTDSQLTQQKLPAWQPILSPPWVFLGFLIVFIIFLIIGIVVLVETVRIQEVEVQYTSSCDLFNATQNPFLNVTGQPFCQASIPFTITQDMHPPIYMYYRLENFYQNHRRYSASRSDMQLGGRAVIYNSVRSECWPIVNVPVTQGKEPTPNEVYSPCGLVPWSMFNDTFQLVGGANQTVLCDTVNFQATNCSKKGIAWDSDVRVKFRPPDRNGTIQNYWWNKSYAGEDGHIIPKLFSDDDPNEPNEDLIVWVRTAALPNFRKLFRIINVPLTSGTYILRVNQNFPVAGFGGKKSMILSTGSWLGGKNLFLAVAYLVVAGICAVLCIAFLIGAIVQRIRYAQRTQQA